MHIESNSGFTLSTGFQKLRLSTSIGVYDAEKIQNQFLEISLAIFYSPRKIPVLQNSDTLEDAHDYALAASVVRDFCAVGHHQLLEHLGLGILTELRRSFPDAQALELTIDKPAALPDAESSRCFLSWRPQV